MTTIEKKEKIKSLVIEMLNESHEAMLKKIDVALDSSAIDIDKWDINNAPMVTPKCIVTAILKRESVQYEGRCTCYEKQIKKDVKSILYYI